TYQTRREAARQRRDTAGAARRLGANEVAGAEAVARRGPAEEREQEAAVERVAGARRLDRSHSHRCRACVDRRRDPAAAVPSELDDRISRRPPPEIRRG